MWFDLPKLDQCSKLPSFYTTIAVVIVHLLAPQSFPSWVICGPSGRCAHVYRWDVRRQAVTGRNEFVCGPSVRHIASGRLPSVGSSLSSCHCNPLRSGIPTAPHGSRPNLFPRQNPARRGRHIPALYTPTPALSRRIIAKRPDNKAPTQVRPRRPPYVLLLPEPTAIMGGLYERK